MTEAGHAAAWTNLHPQAPQLDADLRQAYAAYRHAAAAAKAASSAHDAALAAAIAELPPIPDSIRRPDRNPSQVWSPHFCAFTADELREHYRIQLVSLGQMSDALGSGNGLSEDELRARFYPDADARIAVAEGYHTAARAAFAKHRVDELHGESERALTLRYEAACRVVDMPANSYLGLALKAEVGEVEFDADFGDTASGRGILADLRRLAATAAPSTGLSTTMIPALGMTFGEAAERHAALIDEHNAVDEETEPTATDRMTNLAVRWCAIEDAVSAAEPLTAGDCLAVLRIASHTASPLHDGKFISPCPVGSAVFKATLRASSILSRMNIASGCAPAGIPDAELLLAGQEYESALHAYCNPPAGLTTTEDNAHEREVSARLSTVEVRIGAATATTPAGFELKLRLAARQLSIEEGEDGDGGALVWQVIHALGRLPAFAVPMVADNTASNVSAQIADGLAAMRATVTAFVAKAPAMIQVPAEPSQKLLDAAADKAGISTEQARVFFDSMMSAFGSGRAA